VSERLSERLGFAGDARVAVIHVDDLGMCHAANTGGFEALLRGPATCGSVMVPCPWFAEAAAIAREHPELDLGVHLTLNAEWEGYRWGPVAGVASVPTLVAPDGGFYRTTAETTAHGDRVQVETELRAQIEKALESGIDVTHIDSHMGTVFAPSFVGVYAKLAREFQIPAFLTRPGEAAMARAGLGDALRPILEAVDALAEEGFPVLDGFDANSLGFPVGSGADHNRARLAGLGKGVSYLICHPAHESEELSALTPDAHCRVFEQGFYGGPAGAAALEREQIERIGMRPLRDLLRG